MRSGLSSTLTTKGIEPGVSGPIGLLVVLAILAQAPSTQAQSVGGTASRVAAATASQRATSRSYNRLATTGQGTSAAPTRAATRSGGGYVANAMTPQDDSLHPYTNQTRQALARGSNSEVPAGSSWQPGRRPEPEPEPMPDRPSPRNYYPTMRVGQHPNANVAQVSRARTGVPHICVPNRGHAMASMGRGR
jgi:hypothetical protein